MWKETDLPKVKMIAHVLLDMPIAPTSFSPAIVSHPFTSTGVTATQNEDGNITVVDLLNNKEDYAKWKEMVGKQIDSAENACQVFFLLNKPYYLTFLKFTAPVLSQEDLGQLLAHAWILEECPNQDRNVSKRELLTLEGHLVEVTKDVYLTYYRVERHTKTLDEKDVRNGKVSYSDLDTEETLGEEMVPDPNAESVEDKAVGNILLQELRQCLAQLPLEEQNLIRALYFEELTEREYAKQINISQKAVNKRRHKILSKLRALMKIK